MQTPEMRITMTPKNTLDKSTRKSNHFLAALATAVTLLAVPVDASAGGRVPTPPPKAPTSQPTPPPAPPKPTTVTVRDHRPAPIVRDHRTYVRDHRAPVVPASGGGVTVTSVPRNKPAPQPGYNPVPGHF
jgi:hypothetical protein